MTEQAHAPQPPLEHRAYWSTKQVRQRYGNVTSKSLKRYQEVLDMPEPIRALGVNLYSITHLLAWETKIFGFTVFPTNWDNPNTTELPIIKSEATTNA